MIATRIGNDRVQALSKEQLGEAWIGAITDGALDRLVRFCEPNVMSRLLLPRGLVTLNNAADLVAEFRAWFGSCSDYKVEASRIDRVGEKLGIFYRFLLQDEGDWYRIEQQLYCTLKDGVVAQLHLLCSGFQPVEMQDAPVSTEPAAAASADPRPDDALQLISDAPDTASTCAILTPMIRTKLRGLQSGQVLEVRVNDPQARGDVEAWCRLSGNPLLKMVEEDGKVLRFYVRKK